MTTGDIATWIIALIIFIAFVFGMKRIYHNFSSGKCDSCGSGSSCCGSCSVRISCSSSRRLCGFIAVDVI